MSTRVTRRQAADERSTAALRLIGRELRTARRSYGLSQQAVGTASATPRSKVSRVELGRDPGLSIADATALLAAVGLDLSIRAYPGGEPARDAAHTALLARLRSRIHPSLGWETEVPLPLPGDRRAWDAIILGRHWRAGVEAETHAEDRQALVRRLALKVRDDRVECVILVLARTAANRRFVQANAAALEEAFPVSARAALAALAVGQRPPGSALVLL